jgi:hypothetical protein
MKQPSTAGEIGLSIIYPLLLIGIFYAIDLGFVWTLNHVFFDVFNWFNSLDFFWKIIVLLIGGFTLLMCGFYFFGLIGNLLASLVFMHFPTNVFTLTIGTLIAIANTVYLVIKLWQVPTHFNLWIVLELFLLSIFAWSFAGIAKTKKEYRQETV